MVHWRRTANGGLRADCFCFTRGGAWLISRAAGKIYSRINDFLRCSKMKLGVFGKTGSGVKTLFRALSDMEDEQAGHNKKQGNVLTLNVPDERVEALSEIFKPKKTTFSKTVFLFAIGGEATGGVSQNLLNSVRETDALVIVIKAFDGDFGGDASSSFKDMREIAEEMTIADLSLVEKRIEKLAKQNTGGAEPVLMKKLQAQLESGEPLSKLELDEKIKKDIASFAFLTLKPLIFVFNVHESQIDADYSEYFDKAEELGAKGVVLSAELEAQIAELNEGDRPLFLAEMGIKTSARNLLIREGYGALDMISFFTVGEDEVRAWPVKRDSKAPQAAAVIHTDLEKGFIRAEIISYESFMVMKSLAEAKKKGILRLEGKDYVVKDGDIASFRFNV